MYYAGFGGCLRSELELSGLRATAGGSADWTLRVAQRLPREDLHLLGEATICAGIEIRLYRHRAGFRLTYSDSGSFDIVDGGRSIRWLPGRDHRIELVRLDIINFVMATALHAGGTLCLHASGVALCGAAVAFLGPKRSGKSTLAHALVTGGASLVCDDMLAVRACREPVALAGTQRLRLEPDAAAYFGARSGRECSTTSNRSARSNGSESPNRRDPAVHDATPLAALYILAPPPDRSSEPHPVQRRRLGPAESVVALQANAKIGHLLGVGEAASLLESMTALARQLPVYTLTVTRDLRVLPEVARQIETWHEAPPAAARPASTPVLSGERSGH